MKRFFSFFALFSVISTSFLYSEKQIPTEHDLYTYNNLITELEKVQKPKVTQDYVIFTAPSDVRFVGISFDFEEFRTVHPFQIHRNRDLEGNITESVMFYLLERPATISEIKYRMIIDGLWTNDPNNPETVYDSSTGITLSKVNLGGTLPELTGTKSKNGIHFIYNGESGLTVRLAGTFTNWDSWIYKLEETRPGFYELTLPLPNGTYYYNYYIGMNSVVDKTNPSRAYTDDGKTVSVLKVN